MERVGRTIAFPGAYVWALGSGASFLSALSPPHGRHLRTRAYAPAELSVTAIGDGPLRPAMVLLPATPNGKRFAISERPVTFGEFIRVVGEIAIDARCGSKRLTRDNSERSVVCLSTPRDAAYYANLLTDEESSSTCQQPNLAHALLQSCGYEPHGSKLHGYRLPTVEELSYAATAGSVQRLAPPDPVHASRRT